MDSTDHLSCPRCGDPLGDPGSSAEDNRTGWPCLGCGGVWYEHATFEALKGKALAAGKLDPQGPKAEVEAFRGSQREASIDCPACSSPMGQRHFRFEGRTTPIVLDDCESHGTWFDAGELQAALQVVVAHADAVARHRAKGNEPQPKQESGAMGPAPRDTAAAFRKKRETENDDGELLSEKHRKRRDSAKTVAAGTAEGALEIFADVALTGLFFSLFE